MAFFSGSYAWRMFLAMDKFWEQQLLFFPHLLCKWVNLCATLEESFLKFPNIIFCSDSKKRHASEKKFAIWYNRHVLRKIWNGSIVFLKILSSTRTSKYRSITISLSNFLYYRKNKSVSIHTKIQVTYDLSTIFYGQIDAFSFYVLSYFLTSLIIHADKSGSEMKNTFCPMFESCFVLFQSVAFSLPHCFF